MSSRPPSLSSISTGSLPALLPVQGLGPAGGEPPLSPHDAMSPEAPHSPEVPTASPPAQAAELQSPDLAPRPDIHRRLPLGPPEEDAELACELLGGRPRNIPQWLGRMVAWVAPGHKTILERAAAEEAVTLRAIQEEDIEAKEALLQSLVATACEEVQRLDPQEQKLITFESGRRLPKVPIHEVIGLSNETIAERARLLLEREGGLESLTNELYDKIVTLLQERQTEAGERLAARLEGVLRQGIVKEFAPRLTQSLFEGRTVGAKALLAPLEVVRYVVEKGLSFYLESPIQTELHERALAIASAGSVTAFEEAASAGELKGHIEVAVKREIQALLGLLQKGAAEALLTASEWLPSVALSSLKIAGVGDFGAREKAMWLTFEGASFGRCTVTAHTERGVLTYENVPKDALDTDFFLRLFSYRTRPTVVEGAEFRQEEMLEALFSSFGPPKRSSSKPLESVWDTFFHFSGLDKRAIFDMKQRGILFADKEQTLALAAEAKALRNEGWLSVEEAEAFFLRARERLEALKETRLPDKGILVPPALAKKLEGLISQTNKGWVSSFIVGACGPGAREAVDELLEAVSPTPAEEPAIAREGLWSVAKRNIEYLSYLLLGVMPSDFQSRSFFAHIRVAFFVCNVASFILFPGKVIVIKGAQIIAQIALTAIEEFVMFVFPRAYAKYTEKQAELVQWSVSFFMQRLARYYLSEEERSQINSIVNQVRGELLRSGELSYEVSLEREERRPFTAVLLPREAALGLEIPPPVLPLHAERAALTRDNLLPTLREAARSLGGIPSFWNEWRKRSFILELIHSLPIPNHRTEGARLWDIESAMERYEAMELIAKLSLELVNANQFLTAGESAELQLQLFKLYAITDFLARQCPEAHLDGFTANGFTLAFFTTSFGLPLVGEKNHRELRELKIYFGLNPDKTYDQEEITNLAIDRQALFYVEGRAYAETIDELKYSSERRYYEKLLSQRSVVERLSQEFTGFSGLTLNDQVQCLYLESAKAGTDEASQALREDPILPRPFYFLRMLNTLSHKALGAKRDTRRINEFTPGGAQSDSMVRRTLHNIEPWLGPLYRKVGVKEGDLEYGSPEDHLRSKWRGKGRFAYTSFSPEQVSATPETVKYPAYERVCRVRDKLGITRSFLNAAEPRSQGAIVEAPASLQKERKYEFGLLTSLLPTKGFLGSLISRIVPVQQTYESVFSALSLQDRQALEMIFSDREEQVVRALAFFRLRPHLLEIEEFSLFLELLFLHDEALFKQLSKDPSSASLVAEFFTDLLPRLNNQESLRAFIQLGILVRAESAELNPESWDLFPDFSSHIPEEYYTELAPLPYLFLDPERATEVQKQEAVFTLAWLGAHVGTNEGANHPFLSALSKWKETVIDVLNNDEETRNRVLRALFQKEYPTRPVPHFVGAFPRFTSPSTEIRFTDPLRVEVICDRLSKGRITEQLKPIFKNEPFTVDDAAGIGFTVRGKDITVRLGDETHEVFFTRNGIEYRWMNSDPRSSETLWVNQEREELVTLRNGLFQSISSLSPASATRVHLNKLQAHNLSLLAWFYPASRTDVEISPAGALEKIIFLDPNLSFTVREGEAYSEEYPGFFIAKNQRHEKLKGFSRYLLLQDGEGNTKVLFPKASLASSFASWATFSQTSLLPPLVAEKHLDKFLNELISLDGGETYAFDLTEERGLIADSCDALFFLFCHHLTANDRVEANKALQELISIGNRVKLPSKFVTFVMKAQMVGFLSPNPQITDSCLKLFALIENNALRQGLNGAYDLFPQPPKEQLQHWALLQASYSKYLGRLSTCALSEVNEELPIVEAIAKKGENLLKEEGVGNDLAGLLPIGTLAMAPAIKERYHTLKEAFSLQEKPLDPTGITTYLSPIALAMGVSPADLLKNLQSGWGPTEAILSPITTLILLRKLDWNFLERVNPEARWEEVPLHFHTIQESDIFENFYAYLTLSTASNPSDAAFVERQTQWKKSLKLLQGSSFTSHQANLLILLLKSCAEGILNPPGTIEELQSARGDLPFLKRLKDRFGSFKYHALSLSYSLVQKVGRHGGEWLKEEGIYRLRKIVTSYFPHVRIAQVAIQALTEADMRRRGVGLISEKYDFQNLGPLPQETALALSEADREIDQQITDDLTSQLPGHQVATLLQEKLEELEERVLTYTRALHPPENMAAVEIELEPLLTALGDKNDWTFLRLAPFTPESLQETKKLLLTYLVYATRLNQVQKAIPLFERDPAKARELITTRRGYPFAGEPLSFVAEALLFERGSKLLIRQDQVEARNHLVQSASSGTVVQGKTGLGKTSVLDPMTAQASQAMVVFPKALSPVCTAQISRVMKDAFSKMVTSFRTVRDTSLGEAQLKAILRVFKSTGLGKGVLSNEKNDFLSLQLQFLETLDKYSAKPETSDPAHLFAFQKALGFLREHGRGLFDEVQKGLKRRDELNYPLGEKKSVKEGYVDVSLFLAHHLYALPGVGIDTNTQSRLSSEEYIRRIKPHLVEKLALYFNIPAPQIDGFTHYLLENGPVPPSIVNSERKEEIALAKGLIHKIIPKALEGKIDVNFGPASDGDSLYARPYSGNNSPVESAQIKNPHEAIFKTALSLLYRKLNQQNVRELHRLILDKAAAESDLLGIRLEESETARIFRSWCRGEQNLETFNPETDWELIKDSPAAALSFAKLRVIPEIKYYSENLKADSFAFASMFSSWAGISASLLPSGAYPLDTNVVADEGVKAAYRDHLIAKATPVEELASVEPKAVLNEILARFFQEGSRKKAIIDSGALLHGLSTLEVARLILERTPATIQGVVFFDHNNELKVLERNSLEPISFEKSRLTPEERVTYYSHQHIVGADIAQANDAEAVQTLQWRSKFEELLQGSGRMRGFNPQGQQSITLVTQPGMRIPNATAAIAYTEANENSEHREENYLAERQKIVNVIRSFVLDSLYKAETTRELLGRFQEFRSLFIQKAEDDPFILYGLPEQEIAPHALLERFKEEQLKQIRDSSSFTEEEKTGLERILTPMGRGEYPDTVSQMSHAEDLGVAQEVEESQNQQQQAHQNVEREQAAELEQDQADELRKEIPQKDRFALSPLPAKWDPSIDYFQDLSWLTFLQEETVTTNKSVKCYPVGRSLEVSQDPQLERLHTSIPKNFWWTNNLRSFSLTGEIPPPFATHQKPINELLITIERRDGGYFFHMGAIDFEDVAFWTQKMREDRENPREANPNLQIALFSLGLNRVINSGKTTALFRLIENSMAFRVSCIKWRFLAGIPNLYKRDPEARCEIKLWLEEEGRVTHMRALFERIHARKGMGRVRGSDFDLLSVPVKANLLEEFR